MRVRCCACLRLKDALGRWTRRVLAFGSASDGICPECRARLYPNLRRAS